jgi:two-component system, chemotaxis family, protein-glutamate methylesterase/glutaminase
MPTAIARLQRATSAGPLPVRILVVDDSVVARAALSQIISESHDFVLAAAIDGARRAIEWLKTGRADVILLDIQMPGLNGLTALPDIIAVAGGAQILIVSSLASEGARATVKALSLGAADTIAKPQVGGIGQAFAAQLVEKMERLGRARPTLRESRDGERISLRQQPRYPVACLAIGASTGGLHALGTFLVALSPDFDAPIFVTQHLPTAFMPFFADQIATLSGRIAQVAQSGMRVERGRIYVAPGDAHLNCVRIGGDVRIALSDQAVASRCCPSVDPMFSSIAEVYGTDALAAVLTGMGRDGAIGAEAIAAAGGAVIAQDAASSAVWGMPGTVARAGLAALVAPPAELAQYAMQCGSKA